MAKMNNSKNEKDIKKDIINKATDKSIIKTLKNPTVPTVTDNEKVDVNALLRRLNELEWLVRKTWDTNKIKDYDESLKGMEWFKFSLKLFPTEDWDFPVISWRTLKNYVANEGREVKQTLEIVYIKDWKEIKAEIPLVDFVRILKRTNPILALKLENLDWSEVYVDEKLNAEEDKKFYIIKPKKATFIATIKFEWQTLNILSTYLNA